MLCESHSELQLIVAQENGGHNSYAASRAARQRFGQLPAPQIKQKTVARNPISAPRFADRGAGFQPTSRAVVRPRFSLQLEAIKQHNRPTATWQPASRQIGSLGWAVDSRGGGSDCRLARARNGKAGPGPDPSKQGKTPVREEKIPSGAGPLCRNEHGLAVPVSGRRRRLTSRRQAAAPSVSLENLLHVHVHLSQKRR